LECAAHARVGAGEAFGYFRGALRVSILLPDFVNKNGGRAIHRVSGVFVSGAAMVTRLLAQFAAFGDINAAPSP
jgi:hypothetical protein